MCREKPNDGNPNRGHSKHKICHSCFVTCLLSASNRGLKIQRGKTHKEGFYLPAPIKCPVPSCNHSISGMLAINQIKDNTEALLIMTKAFEKEEIDINTYYFDQYRHYIYSRGTICQGTYYIHLTKNSRRNSNVHCL